MALPIKSLSLVTGAFLAASCLLASGARCAAKHANVQSFDRNHYQGTVEDVTNPTRGVMVGTHLSVKIGDGIETVALGPARFIASNGFAFAKGGKHSRFGQQAGSAFPLSLTPDSQYVTSYPRHDRDLSAMTASHLFYKCQFAVCPGSKNGVGRCHC